MLCGVRPALVNHTVLVRSRKRKQNKARVSALQINKSMGTVDESPFISWEGLINACLVHNVKTFKVLNTFLATFKLFARL